MNFLPADYKSPILSNNYLKMNDGENRIRILSQPIMGWEDWKDNKPVRYTLNEKPIQSIDKEKPIKYFWAFIIYNVIENQIQIMQVTQNTIIKSIESLCKDVDWGNPYHYDIKIRKSGKGMETQYVTSPVPHKPIDPIVIDMFHAKPCNLQAMFTANDPFSLEWKEYTPLALSITSTEEKVVKNLHDLYISKDQISVLTNLVDESDPKLEKQIKEYLRKECGGEYDLAFIKKNKYPAIVKLLLEKQADYKAKFVEQPHSMDEVVDAE